MIDGSDGHSGVSRDPLAGWRVLTDDGQRDPASNLAFDEALARVGRGPTLRLWRNDRSVVLGRFQVATAEVDLAFARLAGIAVVRRFTGGGAVYHDPGNLNVTVVGRFGVAPFDQPAMRRLPGLYSAVLDPIATAVTSLGLVVDRTERDLLIRSRKITGVAGWLGAGVGLVHATLLVDADLDVLEQVLAGPGARGDPRWERTKSRRMPVTSLARELDGMEAFVDVTLETRIALAFGAAAASVGTPTPEERTRASSLFASRYAIGAWHADGIDTASAKA
jgi:lipoate-protein ligase A